MHSLGARAVIVRRVNRKQQQYRVYITPRRSVGQSVPKQKIIEFSSFHPPKRERARSFTGVERSPQPCHRKYRFPEPAPYHLRALRTVVCKHHSTLNRFRYRRRAHDYRFPNIRPVCRVLCKFRRTRSFRGPSVGRWGQTGYAAIRLDKYVCTYIIRTQTRTRCGARRGRSVHVRRTKSPF